MELFTAAHRTRPFDTWVRVHNLDNGKLVEVRINDRGPFVGARIIDLSRAAARTIDMLGPGTALVRVESIPAPRSAPAPTAADVESDDELETGEAVVFGVQVGAFSDLDNAERLRGEMESHYSRARLVVRDGATQVWRVVVGELSDRAAAEDLAEEIRAEHGPAFVVRLDPDDEGNRQSEPADPALDLPEAP
jgi:rare lipoprotein A